jgi:hypothetical protein
VASLEVFCERIVETNLSKGVSSLYHLSSGKSARIASILSAIEFRARIPPGAYLPA